MKKVFIPLLLITVLFLSSCAGKKRETLHTYAFDTIVNITADKGDISYVHEALGMCSELENIFSRTLEESELSKINQKKASSLSADMKNVIDFSLYFSQLTDGAFDITIAPLTKLWNIKERTAPPTESEIAKAKEKVGYNSISLSPLDIKEAQLDLGAVAKGYAADKIVEHFRKNNVSDVIIDLGGNVALIGEYSVGIRNPKSPDSLFAKFTLKDKSAVTSGAYQRYFEHEGVRYHHIIDPRTGYSANSGLSSVTVVSPLSMHADALSTAIYILGKDALSLCSHFPDTDAILITESGEVITTDGFKEKYSLELLKD